MKRIPDVFEQELRTFADTVPLKFSDDEIFVLQTIESMLSMLELKAITSRCKGAILLIRDQVAMHLGLDNVPLEVVKHVLLKHKITYKTKAVPTKKGQLNTVGRSTNGCDPDRLEAFLQLWLDGADISDAIAVVNSKEDMPGQPLRHSGVYAYLKKLPEYNRVSDRRKADIASRPNKIRELCAQGMTSREMSERLDLTVTEVNRIIRTQNIHHPAKGYARRASIMASNASAVPARLAGTVAAQAKESIGDRYRYLIVREVLGYPIPSRVPPGKAGGLESKLPDRQFTHGYPSDEMVALCEKAGIPSRAAKTFYVRCECRVFVGENICGRIQDVPLYNLTCKEEESKVDRCAECLNDQSAHETRMECGQKWVDECASRKRITVKSMLGYRLGEREYGLVLSQVPRQLRTHENFWFVGECECGRQMQVSYHSFTRRVGLACSVCSGGSELKP